MPGFWAVIPHAPFQTWGAESVAPGAPGVNNQFTGSSARKQQCQQGEHYGGASAQLAGLIAHVFLVHNTESCFHQEAHIL